MPLGSVYSTLPIFVDPLDLIRRFDNAVARFLAALDDDPILRQQAEEQAMKWWTPVMFPPTLIHKGKDE